MPVIAVPGATYKHFKGEGRFCVVQCIATHTETGESFVIYTSTDPLERGVTWARPREMFEDGRFTRVQEGS